MFDVFISDIINVTECWDLSVGVGNKLACHRAALSLVNWGKYEPLIGRSGSVFQGNVIPCLQIQTVSAAGAAWQIYSSILTDIPQTP